MTIPLFLASDGSAHYLLQDIGLCIVAATLLAYVARLLRQPLLLAYIGAGVIIGPLCLNWIKNAESIPILAELGLAFLMFIVGLEIDIKKLAATGKHATIITTVQVAGSALCGWIVAKMLGFQGLPAAYIGAALAFSSTMIVVKLLSDRGELDTLPGRVTLGILLLQDVFAIVVLAVQPNIGGELDWAILALAPLKGLGLGAGAILISRYVLPHLFKWVAKSPEIMLMSAVTWCFVVCGAAMKLGFSSAMGALIAGVSMSAFPYSLEVVAKIRSLRDFFVTLFFVSLGLLLKTPTPFILLATLVLTIVTVLTRFVTIWPIVRVLRYGSRAGALSSIHLSQTSEFGLVVALIGIRLAKPHITEDVLTLIVLTLVATSTVSTYLIQFSHQITARIVRERPHTAIAGGGTAPAEDHASGEGHGGHGHGAPIMLIGCFRVGSSLVHELHKAKREFSVVDFNPLLADGLHKLHVPFTYGDISFMDTLEHAGVDKAKVLIASIPDDFLRGIDNKKLLQTLRKVNKDAIIIVTAENLGAAAELYDAGADYVLVPRILSAEHLAGVIDDALAGNLATRKNQSIDRLRGRQEVVP